LAKFQLLHGEVNLAGDRAMSVPRGRKNPMTFPEVLVLRALHGGEEHVHSLVEAGSVDRDPQAEMERLTVKYGKIVKTLFPAMGGRAQLPTGDNTIPTIEDQKAAEEAAAKAIAERKSKSKAKKAKPKDEDDDTESAEDKTDKSGDLPSPDNL
jgi:hypothetical protein